MFDGLRLDPKLWKQDSQIFARFKYFNEAAYRILTKMQIRNTCINMTFINKGILPVERHIDYLAEYKLLSFWLPDL